MKTKSARKLSALVFMFVLLAALTTPHLTIWTVNTLFDLTIPHDLKHWFAALWLGVLMYSSSAGQGES